MRNNIIKSVVFTVLYTLATIAISYFKDNKEILEVLSERWYEYVILFFVILWFNNFIDKKSKNKNKFYKGL